MKKKLKSSSPLDAATCSGSSGQDWAPMIKPIARLMKAKGIGAITILRDGNSASYILTPEPATFADHSHPDEPPTEISKL